MLQTLAPTLDAPSVNPVAFCGMPTGQLPRPDHASLATSAAPDDAPRRDDLAGASATPLRDRVWHLFCSGASYSAIAQQLHLDRQTVTRHVHAVQEMLAADERESLALVRMRAIEAQLQILAATWDAYQTECQREDAYYASLVSPSHSTGAMPHPAATKKPYRAHRARLLSLASTVARAAARLEGLFDQPATCSADAGGPAQVPCPDAVPSSSQSPATPLNEDAVAFCGMPDSPLPPDPAACPSASSPSAAVLSSRPLIPSPSATVPPQPLLQRPPRLLIPPSVDGVAPLLLRWSQRPAPPLPLAHYPGHPARSGRPTRAAPPRTARQRSAALITTRSSA